MIGKHSYCQHVEGGDNRIEKRQVWTVAISLVAPLHNQSLWTELKTIVMVGSERRLWNKTTTEVRFYLSSLASNDEKMLGRFAVIGALQIAYIGQLKSF